MKDLNNTHPYKTMRNYMFLLIFIFGMFLIPNISATNIAACGVQLYAADTYTLAASISGTGNCINFTGSNIDLDCQGYSITYANSGIVNKVGVRVFNETDYQTNVTIRNCNIIAGTAALASHYGIDMQKVNNSLIYNNTIKTNGTATNYGIYLQNITSSIIDANRIDAKGSTTNNYGMYMDRHMLFLNITNNIITTNGTTLNHGIYSLLNLTNVMITNNTITTNTIATGISNHGIVINGNVSYSNFDRNTITIRGITTNYGIWGLGVADGTISNNTFDNNVISIYTNNSQALGNIGILLNSNILYNNVTNNTIYFNASVINYGIRLIGAAGLPISYNNVISNNVSIFNQGVLSGALTPSVGIQLSALTDNNAIKYNNIYAQGNTTYGIYLLDAQTTPSTYNVISYNNITTANTQVNNYGIYATNSWNYNNITYNNIIINGTTGCYGLYILGIADPTMPTIAYNDVSYNVVNVSGITTAFGAYLSTNHYANTYNYNTFNINSTTTPMGMYLLGASGGNSDLNTIMGNNIRSTANFLGANSSYGMLLSSGVNENLIDSNTFYVQGGTANRGLQLLSTAALDTSLNVVNNNTLLVNSTNAGATTYGMYLITNVNENTITSNTVNVYSNITSYALYLTGATYPVLKNVFTSNVFNMNPEDETYTNGGTARTGLIGAYLLTNSNQNEFYYNNISANGRTTSYGMYFSVSSDNIITGNIINATNNESVSNTSEAIYLSGNSQANNFENNIINQVTGNGVSFITSGYKPSYNIFKNNTFPIIPYPYFNFFYRSAMIDGTQFINQNIQLMNFTGKGNTGMVFEDTRYGKIEFLDYINKTQNETRFTNMSNNIQFASNYIFVNSSSDIANGTGYDINKSAAVTLYGVPVFTNPQVFRDAVECSATICTNFSDLGGNSFSFNVAYWSYYQILNKLVPYTYNCTIENISAFLTTSSICDTLNKTRNSLLASPVYTGFAQVNLSATCSMEVALTELTGDMMCDLLRHSKESLHAINVTIPISNSTFNYTGSNTTSTGEITSYYYTS